MCREETSSTGERYRASTRNLLEMPKIQTEPRTYLGSVCTLLLENGSDIRVPVFVQEGLLSPRERMSTPRIQISVCWRTCLALADTYLIIARATINGAIILGQEWNLSLTAALCANYRVHLAWCTLT